MADLDPWMLFCIAATAAAVLGFLFGYRIGKSS